MTPDQFARMLAGADVIAGRTRLPFDQLPVEERERLCEAARVVLEAATASAAPPATGPVCKSAEGCHRVVACDPGCAVTAARMYAKLAAAQSAATDPAQHVTRAIFALKNPPPPGSEHYRAGWDDGLDAAIDAARAAFEVALASEPDAKADSKPAADPAAPSRRAGLRTEIANALEAADYRMDMRRGDLADAVLPVLYREWPWLRAEAEDAVLPAPVDRTAEDELRAEIEKLVRWLREDGTALTEMRATITRLREELAATVPVDRTAVLAEAERAIRQATGSCSYKAEDGCDYCNGVDAALDRLRRLADEAQPEVRPRCPHCHLPHDLTPGSLPVAACQNIRLRLAEAERLHAEGDHSLCCRVDCEVTREHADEAQPTRPPVHLGGRANAEGCPACKVERRNLPYPFLCPAEPGAPAGAAPQPKDTDNPRDVCVCSHTRDGHLTVSGRLLCDACDPDSTDNLVCRGFNAL